MALRERYWAIVGPHTAWISRQLGRLGVRAPDLRDLTQEVLVHVFRHWESFDEARPIKPWLFGFAFRIAADHRKRASYRNPTLPMEDEPADPNHRDAHEHLEIDEARRIVTEALSHVSEERRALLVLVDFEDVPTSEVAESLGIGLATAYSRLRLAREEFASAVKRIKLRRGLR